MLRWLPILVALSGAVSAASVNLAWDPVQDNRLTGYELGWGTTAGAYSQYQPAAGTTGTLDLAEPGPWHVAVRALGQQDGAPIQSAWSNEVVWALAEGPTQPLAQVGLWARYNGEDRIVADFRSSTFIGESGVITLTANVPAGVQNGDLLIAVAGSTDSGTGDGVFNPVTGWTKLISNLKLYDLGGGIGATVYYRVASSEPASYNFTLDADSRRFSVWMVAWSGTDTTTPVESSSTENTYSANDTTVRSASVTTTDASQTVVNIALLFDSNTTTFTAPTNYTEHVDTGNGSGRMWAQISSYAWPSAGATGTVDATASRSEQEKAGIAIVLNNASTAAAGLPRRALDGPFYGALRGSVR